MTVKPDTVKNWYREGKSEQVLQWLSDPEVKTKDASTIKEYIAQKGFVTRDVERKLTLVPLTRDAEGTVEIPPRQKPKNGKNGNSGEGNGKKTKKDNKENVDILVNGEVQSIPVEEIVKDQWIEGQCDKCGDDSVCSKCHMCVKHCKCKTSKKEEPTPTPIKQEAVQPKAVCKQCGEPVEAGLELCENCQLSAMVTEGVVAETPVEDVAQATEEFVQEALNAGKPAEVPLPVAVKDPSKKKIVHDIETFETSDPVSTRKTQEFKVLKPGPDKKPAKKAMKKPSPRKSKTKEQVQAEVDAIVGKHSELEKKVDKAEKKAAKKEAEPKKVAVDIDGIKASVVTQGKKEFVVYDYQEPDLNPDAYYKKDTLVQMEKDKKVWAMKLGEGLEKEWWWADEQKVKERIESIKQNIKEKKALVFSVSIYGVCTMGMDAVRMIVSNMDVLFPLKDKRRISMVRNIAEYLDLKEAEFFRNLSKKLDVRKKSDDA